MIGIKLRGIEFVERKRKSESSKNGGLKKLNDRRENMNEREMKKKRI
jgi:hypothetical protein